MTYFAALLLVCQDQSSCSIPRPSWIGLYRENVTMNLRRFDGSYPLWTSFKSGDHSDPELGDCVMSLDYNNWEYANCTQEEALGVTCIANQGVWTIYKPHMSATRWNSLQSWEVLWHKIANVTVLLECIVITHAECPFQKWKMNIVDTRNA